MSGIPVVNDYMARVLITVSPSDDIHSAVETLLTERISGAPVVDKTGKLVGVLSNRDCLKVVYAASYHQDWGGTVDDYMSKEVRTIESGTDIIVAADLFVQSDYRRFPVLENDHMIGQISRHDILRALHDQWSD